MVLGVFVNVWMETEKSKKFSVLWQPYPPQLTIVEVNLSSDLIIIPEKHFARLFSQIALVKSPTLSLLGANSSPNPHQINEGFPATVQVSGPWKANNPFKICSLANYTSLFPGFGKTSRQPRYLHSPSAALR